jgi:hypothetical protein
MFIKIVDGILDCVFMVMVLIISILGTSYIPFVKRKIKKYLFLLFQ